jgi:hypothetical protein
VSVVPAVLPLATVADEGIFNIKYRNSNSVYENENSIKEFINVQMEWLNEKNCNVIVACSSFPWKIGKG